MLSISVSYLSYLTSCSIVRKVKLGYGADLQILHILLIHITLLQTHYKCIDKYVHFERKSIICLICKGLRHGCLVVAFTVPYLQKVKSSTYLKLYLSKSVGFGFWVH